VFDLLPLGRQCCLRGQIEGIGSHAYLKVKNGLGVAVKVGTFPARDIDGPNAALLWLLDWLHVYLGAKLLVAAGHRVAHGGALFSGPLRVDARMMAQLEDLVALAPLQQAHNLAPIYSLLAERPELPQVACFDTAFHRSQPPEAETFALPWRFYEDGVRRYGFHGLSYEYIARTAKELVPALGSGRTIVAHLGSGVSLCALKDGKSVGTSAGFAADGCPTGTGCGSLDAGVVLHLARVHGMSLDAIESLLYNDSGMLGLSGVSSDMGVLLDSSAPSARWAVDYFVYRVAREAASLAAAMGGLDALVFTASMGEGSPEIRRSVCERLAWMGLQIDLQANATNATRISAAQSPVSVWRIPTNEAQMIAEHTCTVLGLC
jgi:acetate kinase